MTRTSHSPAPNGHRPDLQATRPASWLRELVRIKPAPWPWAHSLRSGFCIAAPLSIGFAMDALPTAMWVAMGALMASSAEGRGGYHTKIRQIITATAMGATGFVMGEIAVLPWILVVLIMALAGLMAGIVSSWGAKFSIGAMQFLQLATIAIGLPHLPPFWELGLLFFGGALASACLLAVESLLVGGRPERTLIAAFASSLGALASCRAKSLSSEADQGPKSEVETARRRVTSADLALGKHALEIRSRSAGRSPEAETIGAVLERGDNAFAEILASNQIEALQLAAKRLEATAKVLESGGTVTYSSADEAEGLQHSVQTFIAAVGGGATNALLSSAAAGGMATKRSVEKTDFRLLLARLTPGRDVLQSALALALCLGLAFCSRWFIEDTHWFWIPLTVNIVMKPDFGSVFARAVLRTGGTVGGAAIGAMALGFLPKGDELVAVIALLAAAMPWAAGVSYAVQSIVLTALVLVLLSFVEPGPVNVDFAVQRIVDTALGSGIVLVFGYFIWPRRPGQHIAALFQGAKKTLASYLISVAERRDDRSRRRWSAYQSLSDLRDMLQGLLVEPPPVNEEAMAWYPLINAAERIADRITAFSASYAGPATGAEAQALRDVSAYVAATGQEREAMPPLAYSGSDPQVSSFVAGIRGELRYMARLEGEDTSPNG